MAMVTSSTYVGSAEQALPSWHDNPFVRFFLWASKTDLRLMRVCAGSTRRTHVARGFFVLGTALAATGASYYFLITTLGSGLAAAMVAVLFGSVIFMFDRELVGGSTVRTAWVRILLSFILGIAISIPFEMRLLEGRLNQEIARQHAAENAQASSQLRQREAEIDARAAAYQNQIAGLREQQQEAMRNKEAEVVGTLVQGQTTGVRGAGPAYKAANDRLHELQGQIEDVQKEIQGLDADRQRAQADYKARELGAVYDFPSRYEAMEKYVPRFSPLWQLGWMIAIIIILFDMFPVLSKFLASPTDYDILQKSEVAEIVHRARKISERNHSVIETEFDRSQPGTVDTLEKLARPEAS
jgi:hypothetical protein